MDQKFYDQVIACIPSADLRRCVQTSADFRFTEKDLLKIILNCAPTWDRRLAMLEDASRLLSDQEMRTLARKRLACEKRQYDMFMRAAPEFVYRIQIKTKPSASYDEYDDTYIVATYDDAIAWIDKYLKYFKIRAKECADARYTITKVSMGVPDTFRNFFNRIGAVGQCVLNCRYEILSLEMYGFRIETACKRGADGCDECRRCIQRAETIFPHYLKKYDLVAYYKDFLYDPTAVAYGIFVLDMDECDDDTYVVLLENNEFLRNKPFEIKTEADYWQLCDAHCHPDYYEIFLPNPDCVPKQIYEDYLRVVEGLKSLEEST